MTDIFAIITSNLHDVYKDQVIKKNFSNKIKRVDLTTAILKIDTFNKLKMINL